MAICILLGAGGHAAVLLAELLRAQPALGLRLVDRNPALHGTTLLSYPVVGDDACLADLLQAGADSFVVACGATGDNSPRIALFEKALALGLRPRSVLSTSAIVSEHASIAEGAQLLPGCIVNARASIGQNVIINTGTIIEHDCVIEDHAHVASGAVLAGAVHVGRGAHVGAGAVIKQAVRIGAGSIVGAGAVVLEDVPAGVVVVGVPARFLRQTRE